MNFQYARKHPIIFHLKLNHSSGLNYLLTLTFLDPPSILIASLLEVIGS
jgi:hypothetical protein